MVRVYCDICGRLLKPDCSDQVNLNFHAFEVSGFSQINKEKNLCVPCAELVVEHIDKLKSTVMDSN